MSNLRKITVADETLEDLVSLINNAKADGVTKVSAELTENKEKMIITLDQGKDWCRTVTIKIEDDT